MIDIEPENTTVVPDSQGTTATPETTTGTEPGIQTTPAPTGTPEESFFDPSSIPTELVPAYKQMQSAFTKKTQEIAQQRKDAEAWKQKAEQFDRYSQHIPIIEEMLSRGKQNVGNPALAALREQYKAAGWNDETIDFMIQGLDFTLAHMNQTQENTRISNQIQEAAKVDPRLTDPNLVYQTNDGGQVTFGTFVERLVEADPAWKQDPVAATKRAINQVDALLGTAKTQGKEELSQSARTKANKFPTTPTSPQGTSDASSTGKTMREIAKEEAAKLGINL